MNTVVRSVRDGDQELGIEYSCVSVFDITNRHRIHVMDVNPVVDIVTLHAKVASIVSNNDVASDIPPFPRRVKTLVEITIEPEGYIADLPSKRKVFKSFFQRIQSTEFGISPNPHNRPQGVVLFPDTSSSHLEPYDRCPPSLLGRPYSRSWLR